MKQVEETKVDNTKPVQNCIIVDSGIVPLDKPYNVDKE